MLIAPQLRAIEEKVRAAPVRNIREIEGCIFIPFPELLG
jgi:hypothetical protein